MIKVALEDALMKLKDHFHGEKHSQQGCFSNCTQTTDDIQKAYSKKLLSACCMLQSKIMTIQLFIVGPQHACRLITILIAHRDCSMAYQDDKEFDHNADCHFCLCCHLAT
jgi:hypothetical protein